MDVFGVLGRFLLFLERLETFCTYGRVHVIQGTAVEANPSKNKVCKCFVFRCLHFFFFLNLKFHYVDVVVIRIVVVDDGRIWKFVDCLCCCQVGLWRLQGLAGGSPGF